MENGKNIFDDIILVLLDENNENKLSKCELRSYVHTIRRFSDIKHCEEYLQNEINDQEKVFLILFNSIDEDFVGQINQMKFIQSIYLFYQNETEYDHWMNKSFQYRKILFSKTNQLYEQLKEDIKHFQNDSIPFHLINQQLNQLPAHFMYSKLLKEILINIKYQQNSKEDFLNYCMKQPNHLRHSQILQEFDNDYEKHSPIWWYTRECLLYQMLNEALRTGNIDVLISMGFFIADLHRAIEVCHKKEEHSCSMIVYRGQGMTNEEFEKIKGCENGLISFEHFLSTSRDKNVSLRFARSSLGKPGVCGILFRMKINRKLTNLSSPYASIKKLSFYENSEKEILFSTHTVFRIESIRPLKDVKNIWQINLRLTTNEEDIQLEELTKHLRENLQLEVNPQESLARLLLIMGLTNKSEEIYQNILINTSENDCEQLAYLYHQLGCISNEKQDFKSSLEYFEKSLEIKKKLSTDQAQLAGTYLNIGSIYHKQNKFDNALFYFNLTLETNPTNQRILASAYNNIGMLYKRYKQYINALENFEKCLQIDLKTLPLTHPDLAITYSNIGRVYFALEDYSNALNFFEKTLQISRSSLPDKHPFLLTTLDIYQKTLELLPKNPLENNLFASICSANQRLKHSKGIYKIFKCFLHK